MRPPYHLMEDGLPTGPHSLLVLRQKAEVHAIRPDTPVRPVTPANAPWMPIRDIPDLHDLLFPARTAPKLGTAQFDAANTASDATHSDTEINRLLRDNTARQIAAEPPLSRSASPYARRHRSFLFGLLCIAAPAVLAYHFVLPQTHDIAVGLISFVGAAAVMLYWIRYHVLDPRA